MPISASTTSFYNRHFLCQVYRCHNKHPIGTRIKFTRTLDKPADDETPAQVYAYAGQSGRIVGHDAREGYQVVADWWPKWFGASDEEFTVLT